MNNQEDVYDTESGFKERPMSVSNADLPIQFQADATKNKWKIAVVTDTLPITVKEFYGLFVAEGCPYSFKKYHESVKDTNLVPTQWAELSSALGYGREMKFFKPVNLPGLASTRGVKVQRYKRFEDYGIIVCSSTRLEDVPAADTFSVEDTIAVKSNENGSVTVEISFQVQFIKSTMMKYIIESSTNSEMKKWLEAFFQHLKKAVQAYKEGKVSLDGTGSDESASSSRKKSNADTEAKPVEAAPPVAAPVAAPTPVVVAPEPKSSLMGDAMRVLVIVLLLVSLLLNYYQWSSVAGKVQKLEYKVEQLHSLLTQLMERNR